MSFTNLRNEPLRYKCAFVAVASVLSARERRWRSRWSLLRVRLRFRTLVVVDDFTRECLTPVADTSLAAYVSRANSTPSLLYMGSRWRVHQTTGLSSPAWRSSAGRKIAASTGTTSLHRTGQTTTRTPSQNPQSDGCATSA
jgi:hypothetical protein